jgi:hypothetical protein
MNEIATVLDRAGLLSPEQREHWKMAWLSTVDHKRIGILYMVTGLVFFVFGGIEALLIRLQLAVPNNTLLHPDTYNMVFTMHGTTMIFLVAMPVLFGLANYIVPLQIGARDRAVQAMGDGFDHARALERRAENKHARHVIAASLLKTFKGFP